MRRYFHISLAFIYLVLCTGVNMYAHFCGNQLSSVSAFIDHASCCCEENPADISNCCKETIKTLKITQEHQANQGVKLLQPIFICKIVPISPPLSLLNKPQPSPISFSSHSPPDLGIPIFIWNCVFTI